MTTLTTTADPTPAAVPRQPAWTDAAPAGRIPLRHTLFALLARDVRVMRRQLFDVVVRALMQPVAFIFVFTYVLPKIGMGGGGSRAGSLSTVLVPGLVAITLAVQGITAVMMPLLLDLAITREIEDRALAPAPIWLIGVQKILSAAFQALFAGLVVFPVTMYLHAAGQAPHVHVYSWPLFIAVLALSCLLAGCVGLLVGTAFPAHKAQQLFAIVVTPLTMLGCVYYPWSRLGAIPWLKVATLANPVVYTSEGLRAALTPQLGHMPVVAILAVLAGGVVVVGGVALRLFTRRVMG